jgi:hypothetical protein
MHRHLLRALCDITPAQFNQHAPVGAIAPVLRILHLLWEADEPTVPPTEVDRIYAPRQALSESTKMFPTEI